MNRPRKPGQEDLCGTTHRTPTSQSQGLHVVFCVLSSVSSLNGIYRRICKYVHMYMSRHTYMYMYIYIYICMHGHVCVYMYIWISTIREPVAQHLLRDRRPFWKESDHARGFQAATRSSVATKKYI